MALHLLTAISDMKSNGECAFYYKWEKEKKKERERHVVRGLKYF